MRGRPHESFQPHPASGDPLPEGHRQGEGPGAQAGAGGPGGRRRGGGAGGGKAPGSIWRFLEGEEEAEAGKGRARRPARPAPPALAAGRKLPRARARGPGLCLYLGSRPPAPRASRGRARAAPRRAEPGRTPVPGRGLRPRLPAQARGRRPGEGTLLVEQSSLRALREWLADLCLWAPAGQ